MTSVEAIQIVCTRVLPRSAAAETSPSGGVRWLITRVKYSAARTPLNTGHAITARSLMTKLSSDAAFDAWPGGIGASPSPMSPATARMSQVPMSTRIAVARFLMVQPTCSSPAM